MKYVYKREGKELRNWDKTNEELLRSLDEIREGDGLKEEMEAFLLRAVDDAHVSEEREEADWSYGDPGSMPSDARCEYAYKPTYLMTLAMINIINRFPEFMDLARVRETLGFALNVCAGRRLRGHGYEAYETLCDNVLLFMRNGIVKFMKDWPLFNVRFEEVIRNALNQIERDYRAGVYAEGWGCGDRREVQEEILRLRNNPVQNG